MRSLIAIAIMTAGIINGLSQTNELTARMHQITLGWQMGLVAKPFIAQKWEEHWEKPLVQWRSELGIVPINQNLRAV
jgi:ubiquinone biosynthesis protein COQ4